MTKKSFVVFLALSTISTYTISISESIIRGTLLGGSAGLPFKFASGTLFGQAHTNYMALIIDVIFWFLIIWGIWKLLQNASKKKK